MGTAGVLTHMGTEGVGAHVGIDGSVFKKHVRFQAVSGAFAGCSRTISLGAQ